MTEHAPITVSGTMPPTKAPATTLAPTTATVQSNSVDQWPQTSVKGEEVLKVQLK